MKKSLSIGVNDFLLAATDFINVSLVLGWVDIQQRYRRSNLGPFWITISMAVTVLGMGMVFGVLFGSPLREFLPFIAVGMIIWTFILSVISEACTTFIASEGIIKQINMPLHVHIFRMIWRNTLIFFHNIIIFPVILLAFLVPPKIEMVFFIPGLALVIVNLVWISMVLAIVCVRFRDLTQIVISVLQLWFFVTPIIWQPSLMIEKGRAVFMDINPFYHLIEIVRAPLLGDLPTYLNWGACLFFCVFGWMFALIFLGHYEKRVAYWL